MTRTYTNQLVSRVLACLCLTLVSIGIGWTMSGHTHHTYSVVPVAALVFFAIMLVVAELGTRALLIWIPLSVFFYPLASRMPGAPIVTFNRIWIGAMLILLATLPPLKASKPTRRVIAGLTILAVVYGTRAIFTPEQRLYVIRLSVDVLVLPLVLFLVVRRGVGSDHRLTERIAFALMVTGAILGLLGVAEHFAGFQLASLSGSQARFDAGINQVRVSGPYPVPETYALSVLMCLAATTYWVQLRLRSRYLVGGMAVALQLAALAFTFFRVAWISAVIILFIAVAFRPRQIGRTLRVSAGFGLIVAIAAVQLSQLPVFTSRVDNTENISSRLGSYDQAIQIWRTRPWTGVGIEQYPTAAAAMPTVYVNGANSEPNPHSSFLAMLAETGVVGFAAILGAAVAIAGLIRAMNRRRWTHADALLAACVLGAGVAYLLFSVSLSMLHYEPSSELFAILLGMAAARVDVLSASERNRLPRRSPLRQRNQTLVSVE
jgi:O-antigen ligase